MPKPDNKQLNDLHHGYLSSASLRLQRFYQNTWLLCFQQRLELEMLFPSISSLRTVNWERWTLFAVLSALILAYLVFTHTASAYIPLRISFTSPCSYRIITLTSLQLHHHTYIIKITSITSLHLNYITRSNLITSYTLIISLHHSRIPSICPVTIRLRISTGILFPHSAPTFLSFL